MNEAPRQLPKTLTMALAVALLAVAALPAGAQLAPNRGLSSDRPAAVAAVITPSCSGGIVIDDGSFESGIRFTDASTGAGLRDAVMRFPIGGTDVQIEQVCLCWFRGSSASANLNHDILVFAADGPNGAPGSQIAAIPATASGIGVFQNRAFFSYDISSLGLEVTGEHVYVGARWNGGAGRFQDGAGIFLCSDDQGPGGQPMYAKVSSGTAWSSFEDIFVGPAPEDQPPHAVGVRIDTEDLVLPCPTTPCVEDDFTLCLSDDRFALTAAFDTVNDPETTLKPAHAVPLTPDTGFFWFFNPNNIEAVVKIRNACVDPFNHFWFFAGGLTNVEVAIEVCDTEAGQKRVYRNPQSTPFQPIQDTTAFATCP